VTESSWDETIILDCDHLSGFTGGDPDFECEVLDIFLSNAPDYLETLCNSESERWRVTAHKLKGAARSIGAWRLARSAERAERMAAPMPGDPRRVAILKDLGERLAALVEFIRDYQIELRNSEV